MVNEPLKTKAIILGAGRPYTGEIPSMLDEVYTGQPVLNLTLQALNIDSEDITLVLGFKSEEARKSFPNFNIVENWNWSSSGSAESLALALEKLDSYDRVLVCYSDVLFRKEIIDQLEATNTDICVAFDSKWRERFSGRPSKDIICAEKVSIDYHSWRLRRIGKDIPSDWANGEFIGVFGLSKSACEKILFLRHENPTAFFQLSVADCIEYLVLQSMPVSVTDVYGDWAEFNHPQDIAQFILGTKAETLKRLKPIVQKAKILDQVSFTVADWKASQEDLISKIEYTFPNQNLVVRSSAISEDTFHTSSAGRYTSILNVQSQNRLITAIEEVIASFSEKNPNDQVLVQPMVKNVKVSGVAFTRTLDYGAPWYVINYETSGDTEAITSGASSEHFTLYMSRSSAKTCTIESIFIAELVDSIKEIENLLSYDYLDIEFAIDDNSVVYIFQVRPLVRKDDDVVLSDEDYTIVLEEAKKRYLDHQHLSPHLPTCSHNLFGLMPDWNPAEILGTSPSQLAVSLYEYLITDEVWAQQRAEFGYRDVRPAPLLETFSGTPYVDVRHSFASFIPANIEEKLASRLLDFYCKWLIENPHLHDKIEFDVVPTCFGPSFERWRDRFVKNNFCLDDITLLEQGLKDITANAFDITRKNLDDINTLSQRYDKILSDKNLTDYRKFWLMLEDCRKYGTLPFAHLARCGFVAMTLLKEAVSEKILSAEAVDSFMSTIRTVSHDFTEDAQNVSTNQMSMDEFISKYGHLRPGTYDINSPRYDEDPDVYLEPLITEPKSQIYNYGDSTIWKKEKKYFCDKLKSLGFLPENIEIEKFLREAIEGREYAKFLFSRSLSKALQLLEKIGSELGIDKQTLSLLSYSELIVITDGKDLIGSELENIKVNCERRAREQAISARTPLPYLLSNVDDFDYFIIGADQANFVGTTSIISNTFVYSENELRSGAELANKIVLIPSADPGYDWIFGHQISGLITKFGGANSHMAIRAAEFGLPAAIGVGEVSYELLSNATLLELSPGNKIVRPIQ